MRAAASALLCLTLIARAEAAEPDPELAYAEKALQDAKVKTDGASLLAFFKGRTLSDEDRAGLSQAVRRLGDTSFEAREQASKMLRAAGHSAKQYLAAALKDPDPEVRRRAEACLQALEDSAELVLTANAAKVLAARAPAGAAVALLAYLPQADEEMVEEAVHAALAALTFQESKADPAVVAALADKEPARRAAAAYALGRGPAEHRRTLGRLLADADAKVRYHAAAGLLRAGDKDAVPALIGVLQDGSMRLAYQAEDLLIRLAGDQPPPVVLGGAEDGNRRKARDAWSAWWKDNAPKVDLAKVNVDDAYLGLTVICEYDGAGRNGQGRVWECGPDGKQRWEIDTVDRPMDVQVLPGGRFLIAENGGKVTERDRQGKVLWQQNVPSPVCCQRLPNGNTFVASYTDLYEFTRDGKTVFTARQNRGSIYYAQKLRNGNYVYVINTGQIYEIDARGAEVRVFMPSQYASGAGYWASVEALPNGRFLVGLGSANKVVEIDTTGRICWSCDVENTCGGTRLRNGHTLAVSTEARRVVEFDQAGKEVWSQKTVGRPFRVRRY